LADLGPGYLINQSPGLFILNLTYVCSILLITGSNQITRFMRNFLTLILVLISQISLQAQSYKSSLTFQNNLYRVAALQVPYGEDVVTDAVKEYMSTRGFKDAHYKDFLVFRSVPLEAGSSTSSDAYFTVARKSHSEKDVTVISLLPVKKGETLLPASAEDSSFLGLAMNYLDSMNYHMHSYSIKQQIQAQQKLVDKIKSKMLDLKNDSGDLAKKIRSYDADLQQNKKDQDKQTREISSMSSSDEAGLAKAHKKMDKLMDNQTDIEKKLRNYKAELEKNTESRATEQSIFETANGQLVALQKKLENLK
jgi:hypothetical protein